ncbi:unnamed protein product [Adineta steineri]|uniref:Uncharacterized protein n=1 Tax=Adineta steineri TaxID=433720 RepID=A0A818ZU43_9BILA|nr:unnamed protein product [Adineta steineri]CAF3769879.1 unnamed protein product [Adineta steineri]
MTLYSTKPQIIQNNNIICVPINVTSLKAIAINVSSSVDQITLKSIDGRIVNRLTPRGYLYIQLSISLLLFDSQKCFQIDLDSSNVTGHIQFIYKLENIEPNTNTIQNHTIPFPTNDPCTTRRIKCKNGGRCQVTSNGQTKCLCPENVTGTDCESIGIRCTDLICINQAYCSSDNRSCVCQLGNQGRDCSTRCGESYIQPKISSDRIINGETVVKNSWPYIVYIQIGERSWCGGSLIDSWNVLTAAHCTYGRHTHEFTLWFGVHKLDERINEMNMGIVEKRSIQQIINHPNYTIYPIKTYENDLAILRLSQSVEETAYIRYLCILPPNNRIINIHLDDQVEIVGWGYINKLLSNGTFIRQTNELQQAMITVLPDYNCMEYKIDDQILFQSKYMICAGSKDYKTDSCQGDSGGPLMIKYNNQWYAIGLVSFGSTECAKQGAAGVYTRLSMYSEWIYQYMIP